MWLSTVLYFLALGVCLSPLGSPPLALALGLAVAFLVRPPFPDAARRFQKPLLQTSVVLLGFTMNLAAVLRAGCDGLSLAAVTIVGTLLLGLWVGRLLGMPGRVSALIAVGTAICGGSAIAAVGTVVEAEESEMTVAMGTVFILNAVALYLLPPLGQALGLTQGQFGTWAGVAVHDISSVVGAAARFGFESLQTATAVKLSRALWIVPVALAAARLYRPSVLSPGLVAPPEHGPTRSPRPSALGGSTIFIGLFLVASVLRTLLPGAATVEGVVGRLATTGMTVTLFLIGSSLSLATLKKVGWQPLVQGVVLWTAITAGTLVAVLHLAV